MTLEGPGDRTARIYLALRAAVLDGRLASGDRVPATRDLAAQLGVARGTVTLAYDRLVAEGFLESRPGAGTFVTTILLASPVDRTDRRARPGVVRPLGLWSHPQPPPGPHARRLHDLGIGLPDPALFPLAVWRRLVAQQLRRSRLTEATYDGRGAWRLQAEIARFLGLTRSVVASGDDVIVTAGAQQAIDLVSRVLVEPGDVVAVEDPGYPAVARLLETHRAVVRGVQVDGEGLVVEALPATARLVYVTPSHQFPTGTSLSLRRRAALLRWAVDHDAVVVEDDYDSDYRFSDQPVEPLQSLDREGRVVYVVATGATPADRLLQKFTEWDGDVSRIYEEFSF